MKRDPRRLRGQRNAKIVNASLALLFIAAIDTHALFSGATFSL